MGIVDDALVGSGSAGEMELPGEFDAFPSREECTAVLTMKCGDPLKAVRKKLHDEVTFTFLPEEGFNVFLSKVERHYSKLDKAFVQEQRGVYLKPSSNATQIKYVLLTAENFDPLLRMRWKIARSMKVELKYEVFSYFVDASNKKEKKRLSMKMFQPEHPLELHNAAAAAAAVGFGHAGNGGGFAMAHALPHGLQTTYADMGVGMSIGRTGKSAAGTALLLGNANNKDDSGSDRPRKAARSVQRATAVGGDHLGAAVDDEPFFQAIPVRINGFVVPLEVDIAALRRCLGLAPSLSSNSTGIGADTELDA